MTPRRQFFITALLGIALLGACILFNVLGNRMLCVPKIYDIYGRSRNAYMSIMIRHNDYNALIAGSSMSSNFRCTELDSAFGVQSLKIAQSGLTMPGAVVICRYALELRKVSLVQMDLTTSLFVDPEQTELDEKLFDSERPLGSLKQYISFEETIRNLKMLLEPRKEISRDDYDAWYRDYRHTDILRNFARSVFESERRRNDSHYLYDNKKLAKAERVLDYCLLPLINEYKDVTFYLFFPPHTFFTFEGQDPSMVIAYRRLVSRKLLSCPNVRLFDFQDEEEITSAFANYRDYSHYLPVVSSWIIQQMAAGGHRVTTETLEEHLEKMEKILRQHDIQADYAALRKLCPDWNQLRKSR